MTLTEGIQQGKTMTACPHCKTTGKLAYAPMVVQDKDCNDVRIQNYYDCPTCKGGGWYEQVKMPPETPESLKQRDEDEARIQVVLARHIVGEKGT